jgi:four helix bundle protein
VELGNWEIDRTSYKFYRMTEKELKIRTRKFAVDILNFVDKLPNRRSGNIIGNQLGRSASSVAANYRAACRGRSHAEFIAKIGIVEEEADESTFWLDIIPDTKNASTEEVEPLLKEARELTAIFTAASKTAKQNKVK